MLLKAVNGSGTSRAAAGEAMGVVLTNRPRSEPLRRSFKGDCLLTVNLSFLTSHPRAVLLKYCSAAATANARRRLGLPEADEEQRRSTSAR